MFQNAPNCEEKKEFIEEFLKNRMSKGLKEGEGEWECVLYHGEYYPIVKYFPQKKEEDNIKDVSYFYENNFDFICTREKWDSVIRKTKTIDNVKESVWRILSPLKLVLAHFIYDIQKRYNLQIKEEDNIVPEYFSKFMFTDLSIHEEKSNDIKASWNPVFEGNGEWDCVIFDGGYYPIVKYPLLNN